MSILGTFGKFEVGGIRGDNCYTNSRVPAG
jgi:hypothetical protein